MLPQGSVHIGSVKIFSYELHDSANFGQLFGNGMYYSDATHEQRLTSL